MIIIMLSSLGVLKNYGNPKSVYNSFCIPSVIICEYIKKKLADCMIVVDYINIYEQQQHRPSTITRTIGQ